MAAISVEQDNPYITGFTYTYLEGDQSLERNVLKYQPSNSDKLHPVRNFDNLSDISYDYYGSSKWWWVIADVNNIEDPFTLVPNTNLIIPDLGKVKVILT